MTGPREWLMAWILPDGSGGYTPVMASSFADAVRTLRFSILPEYAATLKIVQAGVI